MSNCFFLSFDSHFQWGQYPISFLEKVKFFRCQQLQNCFRRTCVFPGVIVRPKPIRTAENSWTIRVDILAHPSAMIVIGFQCGGSPGSTIATSTLGAINVRLPDLRRQKSFENVHGVSNGVNLAAAKIIASNAMPAIIPAPNEAISESAFWYIY